MLRVIRPICCGVDVQGKLVVATIDQATETDVACYQTKTFGIFNDKLN